MPISKRDGCSYYTVQCEHTNNCLNNLLEEFRGQGPTAYEQSIVCSKTITKNNFRFLDCIILANHCLNTHALLLLSIKRTSNVCDFSLREVYRQIPTFSSSLEMSIWMKISVRSVISGLCLWSHFSFMQRNLTTPSHLLS